MCTIAFHKLRNLHLPPRTDANGAAFWGGAEPLALHSEMHPLFPPRSPFVFPLIHLLPPRARAMIGAVPSAEAEASRKLRATESCNIFGTPQ